MRLGFLLLLIFLSSWGFKSHRKISEMAINYVPNNELFSFFKNNAEFIIEHSVDPDLRKFSNHGEITSHFIDMDIYLKRFSKDSLKHLSLDQITYLDSSIIEYGILPWRIQSTYHSLVQAFKKEDKSRILRKLTDLSHYISDACVPLHTNSNYNGQKTNQLGIHPLWETQIPELFLDTLINPKRNISYESDLMRSIWNVIDESYEESKLLLKEEKNLRVTELKVNTDKYGRTIFTEEYRLKLSDKLNLKVEDRLIQSSVLVAQSWYSAWIDAGQPDLPR